MVCCNISVCRSNKLIHQVLTIIGKKPGDVFIREEQEASVQLISIMDHPTTTKTLHGKLQTVELHFQQTQINSTRDYRCTVYSPSYNVCREKYFYSSIMSFLPWCWLSSEGSSSFWNLTTGTPSPLWHSPQWQSHMKTSGTVPDVWGIECSQDGRHDCLCRSCSVKSPWNVEKHVSGVLTTSSNWV